MKNSVILLAVFVLFSAVPAMAQNQSPSSAFNSLFGRQAGYGEEVASAVGGDNVAVRPNVNEENEYDIRNFAREEIGQSFADKSFTVIETEDESVTFTVEATIFSGEKLISGRGYYRYYYHAKPETVVFVTVKNRLTGAVVVKKEGKDKNLHRAIEIAAENAASKLKKISADRTIFLP